MNHGVRRLIVGLAAALLVGGTLPVAALAAVPSTVDDSATVAEDGTVTIDVLANDLTDAGPVSIASVSGPPHGTASVAGDPEKVDYTPDPDFNGTDVFTYVANNADGDSEPTSVTVTVTPVNDAPVAVDDARTTLEDMPVTVDAGANDTDIDGDPLTIVGATDGAKGSVVVALDGSALTYGPNLDANGLDSFTYTISDGHGGTSTARVSITISAQNDAPDAVDDNATVPEGDDRRSIFVLDNDTDVEGGALTITTASDPPHGSVVVSSAGSGLTYEPDTGYSGLDAFAYTISDGGGGSDTATVTIDISGINGSPNAVNDLSQSVPEGAGPTLLSVLANDSDPDGDTFTIISTTDPANGAVAITDGGTGLTYDPATRFHGIDTFTYTLRDAGGATDSATVRVTVTKDATPPILVAPVQRLIGQTVGTSTIRTRLGWSATDAGSGIRRYQLQQSVNGRAYVTLALAHPTTVAITRTLSDGTIYRYRVRATDNEGNTSAWRYSPILRPHVFQETTAHATYTGTWSTARSPRALGGAVRFSARLGRTVRFVATAYDLALVVTKTPTSGQADILVDGVVATRMDLRAWSRTFRQLVFTRHFVTRATHSVEVRPVGDGRVDVDAFAVLR
jgi:hypothetical protein